jgi:hypothetical protein
MRRIDERKRLAREIRDRDETGCTYAILFVQGFVDLTIGGGACSSVFFERCLVLHREIPVDMNGGGFICFVSVFL